MTIIAVVLSLLVLMGIAWGLWWHCQSARHAPVDPEVQARAAIHWETIAAAQQAQAVKAEVRRNTDRLRREAFRLMDGNDWP